MAHPKKRLASVGPNGRRKVQVVTMPTPVAATPPRVLGSLSRPDLQRLQTVAAYVRHYAAVHDLMLRAQQQLSTGL